MSNDVGVSLSDKGESSVPDVSTTEAKRVKTS
jgi:hypothetical protein